ncbi:uncharacterized protein Triagg1_4527 [Trichoderma aggressivum f. europaeum]|uniref:Uncharacterized protein n=1 Tax=Trichoderma aggressivum f. europaeum TaxID=173218 RepID=A0AAE1M188_9HYPO|nr:hypothetical protein Triagg1_4527 [Trichoderma aggressivum f. europaeum]
MAMLSAASRSKRLHPPPMAKETASKSESRTKALGPPYDYQRLKKCNSQQALDNPDWRTRPSGSSSSPTMDDEQVWRNLIGAGKQWIGMDAFPTTPSAGERNHEAHLEKANDSSQDRATVSSDLRYHRRNIFALSSEMEPKIMQTMEEEQPVPYGILKQVCLSSSKEHPLSLLEVAPLGSIPSFLSPSVVDIRPLKGNLMQRKPGNGQDEQLTAALKAAEATPHKVRMHMSQRSRHDEAKMKHVAPDEWRAQKGVFELPGIVTAQRNRAHDCSDANRLSPNQTARLVNEERPKEASETDKDQAFQRFLKKLGQKTRDLPNVKLQGRDRVDSGYEDGSKEEQSGGSTETCILRFRTHEPYERQQIPLEAFAGRRTRGPEIAHKENASLAAEQSTRFKSLNPKAREFLSFVSNRSSNSEDDSMEPLAAFAPEPFASKSGHANAMSLAGLGLPNVSSLQQPPPPYGLAPLAPTPDTAADALALNNLMAGRLIPVQVGTDQLQLGGHFPTSALPMPSVTPLPSHLPPMFRPPTVLQSVSMMSNHMSGIPTVPSMANTAFPLAPISNPCFNMPSCQMPLMTGARCAPQPVPKPRRPDPGDQQAYEAYIEWRKANEPGYALECRLRQQRRAQRSMTDKVPPKTQQVKKDDASTEA